MLSYDHKEGVISIIWTVHVWLGCGGRYLCFLKVIITVKSIMPLWLDRLTPAFLSRGWGRAILIRLKGSRQAALAWSTIWPLYLTFWSNEIREKWTFFCYAAAAWFHRTASREVVDVFLWVLRRKFIHLRTSARFSWRHNTFWQISEILNSSKTENTTVAPYESTISHKVVSRNSISYVKSSTTHDGSACGRSCVISTSG
jgi:hypothetical protein